MAIDINCFHKFQRNIEDTYKTISIPSEGSYRVLASRHLAFAFPVYSEAEIAERINALRKEYHNATHVCYAWRLGHDKKLFRSNDDGEPSGTAGKPILGQIKSADLTNILVCVVRYFGGTKLGTSGLIDAYRTAAKLSLESATIIEKQVEVLCTIHFPYSQLSDVMKVVKDYQLTKQNMVIENTCKMEVIVRLGILEIVKGKLQSLSDVKVNYTQPSGI